MAERYFRKTFTTYPKKSLLTKNKQTSRENQLVFHFNQNLKYKCHWLRKNKPLYSCFLFVTNYYYYNYCVNETLCLISY